MLISCAALVSHSAFAADLEADMKTLAKSTKAFAEAKDIDNAKTAACDYAPGSIIFKIIFTS